MPPLPTDSDTSGIAPDTSTGLLRDLEKGAGATRWQDFHDRYDPVVRRFLAIIARTHSLVNPADCDDLVQETMITLCGLFPRRVYNRSQDRFRDFLFGVVRRVATHQTSREWTRRCREEEAIVGMEEERRADAADARFREEARELWQLVVDRVFTAGRWSDKAKAVYIRTEEGEPMDEIAREYGMTLNSVHQLRYRAARRVEAELRRLARPGGELSTALRENHP